MRPTLAALLAMLVPWLAACAPQPLGPAAAVDFEAPYALDTGDRLRLAPRTEHMIGRNPQNIALARLAQQHRENTCLEIASDSDEDRMQNLDCSLTDHAVSFSQMFATPQNVAAGLREAGYATDPVLVQIIWLATKMQKPILVEGPPGTGKTYLAQAFAAAARTDLIRLQCFEGITEKQAIGVR